MKPSISTAPAVLIKPPRRVVLGKKQRGRVTDDDVISDFLFSFCHVAMERCSAHTAEWPIGKFGPSFEHKKCPDSEFQRHVADSCSIARQYLAQRRLYAFEVCMISASDEHLISFRVVLSQLEFAPERERVRNIYARLSQVLESTRTLKIAERTHLKLCSSLYRPRIRMLTRLRPQSQRVLDKSKIKEKGEEVTIAIGDSLWFSANFITFYAHM